MEAKPFWTSKTLWVNLIGIIAIVAQGVTGKEIISMEIQASILAGINMVLRFISKKPITWE